MEYASKLIKEYSAKLDSEREAAFPAPEEGKEQTEEQKKAAV